VGELPVSLFPFTRDGRQTLPAVVGVVAHFSLRLPTRIRRFFCGIKSTNTEVPTIQVHRGAPFLFIRGARHTNISATVSGRSLEVLAINAMRHVTKIRDAIIGWIPVDMVDGPARPLSSVNGPTNAVRKEYIPQNITLLCAPYTRRGRKSFFLREARLKTLPKSFASKHRFGAVSPIEKAGAGLKSKKLAAKFGCDIGAVSHSVLPHVRGQGRARVQPRFRPAFYTLKLAELQRSKA
jgi:hypothetical protein